jgi:hypothetical protein
MIYKVEAKFWATGSVLARKKGKKRHILTKEKLDEIVARLEASPKKSLCSLSVQFRVLKLVAHIAKKLLILKLYRTNLVYQLLPRVAEEGINYCRWFQQSLYDGVVDPELMFYTSEVWFHLSGYVTCQNSNYWSTKNPHSIHEVPLRDAKIGLWCVISAQRIIRALFFQETLNSEWCVRLILTMSFCELMKEEKP